MNDRSKLPLDVDHEINKLRQSFDALNREYAAKLSQRRHALIRVWNLAVGELSTTKLTRPIDVDRLHRSMENSLALIQHIKQIEQALRIRSEAGK